MKKLWIAAAALVAAAWMTVPAFGAEEKAVTKESARQTASQLVPEDGAFQYTEQCSDAFEVLYYSEEERSYYAVRVSIFTGEVSSISSTVVDDKGSREAVLTEDEVKEIVASDAGEVNVDDVILDTVAGRKKYEVSCTGDGFEAGYVINPESGRILKKTVVYL